MWLSTALEGVLKGLWRQHMCVHLSAHVWQSCFIILAKKEELQGKILFQKVYICWVWHCHYPKNKFLIWQDNSLSLCWRGGLLNILRTLWGALSKLPTVWHKGYSNKVIYSFIMETRLEFYKHLKKHFHTKLVYWSSKSLWSQGLACLFSWEK